jgi:hypothetical protein
LEVGLDESAPTVSNTDELEPVLAFAVEDKAPNNGVEAGSVSARCQNTNSHSSIVAVHSGTARHVRTKS